jgi:hypothetical protein
MSDLDIFFEWFEKYHPALYKKYNRNFTISPDDGQTVAVNNNYRISQKEFEHITHVASSFYNKTDVELFDSVEYVYSPEMRKDETAESAMLLNTTMWLKPIIKDINMAEGKLRITFIKPGINAYWVENISGDLINKAKELSERFQSPFHL